MDDNKTIACNPDWWTTKKSSRKRTTKSDKQDSAQTTFDSKFTQQLNSLHTLLQNQQSHGPEPIYGNLRNGTKPTYKMVYNNSNQPQTQPPTQPVPENTVEDKPTKQLTKLGKCSKKTARIMIKGKKSRRRIKRFIKDLSTHSITEMKNDLYKNSLIRCGSSAPPDVIKEIYKNKHLVGPVVSNTNGDNLLHNFYATPDES